jgi:hypothetical protein
VPVNAAADRDERPAGTKGEAMKRFMAAAGVVVATAALAGPALAGGHHSWQRPSDLTFTFKTNTASQMSFISQDSKVVIVKADVGGQYVIPASANLALVGQTLLQVNN